MQLPRYRCHKVVEAFKITDIQPVVEPATDDIALLGDGIALVVPAEYVIRHKPHIGGYYVRYQDGYESFSPAEAFEAGYSLITP